MARKVRFGDYEVDFARRELRKCGFKVGLQHKPFRVLELLLRKPGELVTREELIAHLWPDSHVSFEHGLNTAVNSLRLALGESSRACHYIERRPGIGYRFSAPVEELTEVKNLNAYEDCLKGRYFLDKLSREEIHKAIAYFNSAAADETCSSLARAGLADAYCQLALVGSICPSQVARHARSHAEFSIEKDAQLPQAHISNARVKMIFDWDWQGARAAVTRALELDFNSVPAHTLHASLLCALGRCEDALRVCREALALDPLSFPANLQLAACLLAARDFKGAVDQCWNMLTLTPRFAPAQVLLALAYEQLGLYEEAIDEFRNAQTCAGFDAAVTSGLAHVFSRAGRQREAEQACLEVSSQAETIYISCYSRALVCAARQQHSQALSFLKESIQQRDPASLWLNADPRFDALRLELQNSNQFSAMDSGYPVASHSG